MTVNQDRRLRRLLDDRIDATHQEADAYFSSDDIADLLQSHSNIYGAAAEGWADRAAHYRRAIDIMENGSDRKLGTLFKNALAMANHYSKLETQYAEEEAELVRGGDMVVGVAFGTGDSTTQRVDTGIMAALVGPDFFPYPVQRMPVIL